MTLETDVAAISSRTLWLRARDLTGGSGSGVTAWPDRDGIQVMQQNPGTSPQPTVSTDAPPLSSKSVFFNGNRGLAVGRVVQPIVAAFAGTSFGSGFVAENVFDALTSSEWASNLTTADTIGAQFATAFACNEYRLQGRALTAANQTPKDWTFQGSNDGSSWTTLDTRTGQNPATLTTYTFTNSTTYTYYRLNVSAVQSGGGAVGLATMALYGTGAPWTTIYGGTSGEVWAVVKATADGSMFHKAGTGVEAFYPLGGIVYDDFGATTRPSFTPAASTTVWHTVRIQMDSGTKKVWIDGVLQDTTSGLTVGWADVIMVGKGDTAASANDAHVKVAELVSFSAALSSGDATKVSSYLTDKHFTAAPVPVTGTVAGASPSGSGALVGTAPNVGTVAGTSPSGTGFLVGSIDNTTAGTLTGTSPSGTGTIVGVVPTTGAVAGVSPSGVGSLTGVVPAPITGIIAGASPSGVGSLTGVVTLPGAVTGTIAGSGPRAAGSISGIVGDPTIESPTVSLTHTPVGILSVIPLLPSTELDHAVPVTRESILAPVLSAEYPAHPAQGSDGAPVIIDGIVGQVHLWIDGQDVTYWRGGITEIKRWESEAPFGDTVAAFSFPQKNPWDVDGEGDLSFLREDAPVAIGIVETTEGDGFTRTTVRRLWSGFLDAKGSGLGDGEFYDYEAKGTLWQAQSNNREPHAITEPVDIGVWIARVLNAVDGRRWATMPLTPIGITTTTRGSRDDMAMEYVQALLTEAITDDLRQWTLLEVAPGIIRLVLKPAPSTVHATVAYGTPGVDISLRVDQSTRVDRVFMRGIGPKAGGWANVFYPGLETLTAPAYPMAGFASITLGTTDADTTSGTGVTDWQRRVDELRGFANPPVSGVMSSAWVAVIDDLQRRVGVTADGSLGPQTWNATFDRAIAGVDLTPRRLAMASKPEAEKYLYTATGVRLPGVNPAWDGRIPRDVGIDAGPGKSKAQGFKLARKILGMYGTAAASGTIDWVTDPNETDRTRISHLSNIKVLGFEGRDVVVQVASKVVELDGDSDGKQYVVTTRVDERARDATAVEDLLEQRRNAQADPSRNPLARNRASRQVSDQRTPWDSESPCGVLRRTAVNGASGLPSIITVPFAEVGQLSGIRLKSTRPFAFAIFESLRITENKLMAIMPEGPFSTDDDPWIRHKDAFDEYFINEAWGVKGQRCGFSPGSEDKGSAFTGDFILNTPVDYATETVPYVAIAVWMDGGSGWIEGQFIPAYEA